MKIVLLPFFVGFIVLSDEGPETFVWENPKGSERFREIMRDSWYKTNSEIFQLLGTVKHA